MNTPRPELPHERPLHLAKGELARLGDVCGAQVECRHGTLWITLDHDTRDVVLDAGQSFAVRSRENVLVHAILGPAEAVLRRHAAGAPR